MVFKPRTLRGIAQLICGDRVEKGFFRYRSSFYLTEFFQECDTDYRHDGSTRAAWVAETLEAILREPQSSPQIPPDTFLRVISRLMAADEIENNDDKDRSGALAELNLELVREGLEACMAEDKTCYLRTIATKRPLLMANPHRPFSPKEEARRAELSLYLDGASEDQIISEVLLPLFRQLGFHRITAPGHKDKALEFGKDIWMRFVLPTQHVLYFGLQVKKGKLDAAGMSKGSNSNIAEVYNQCLMMLANTIFDPETNKKVLVDHAFIVAGGEITKAAKAWLGEALDTSKRSQIMFIDRDDILNLYVVTNLPLPETAKTQASRDDDDIPF